MLVLFLIFIILITFCLDISSRNKYTFIHTSSVAKVSPQVINKCVILPDKLVERVSCVNSVNQPFNILDHAVGTVGIYGMVWIGKTSISRAVFNYQLHYVEEVTARIQGVIKLDKADTYSYISFNAIMF